MSHCQGCADRDQEIERLREINAKHVLNRIEIEGQFADLRAVVEAARALDEALTAWVGPGPMPRWIELRKALRAALSRLDGGGTKCDHCGHGVQDTKGDPLRVCPKCGAPADAPAKCETCGGCGHAVYKVDQGMGHYHYEVKFCPACEKGGDDGR